MTKRRCNLHRIEFEKAERERSSSVNRAITLQGRNSLRLDELSFVTLMHYPGPDAPIGPKDETQDARGEVPLDDLGELAALCPLFILPLGVSRRGTQRRRRDAELAHRVAEGGRLGQRRRDGDGEVEDILVEQRDEVVVLAHDPVRHVVGIEVCRGRGRMVADALGAGRSTGLCPFESVKVCAERGLLRVGCADGR